MRRSWLALVWALAVACFGTVGAVAQQAPAEQSPTQQSGRVVNVGVYVSPPFVMAGKDRTFSGMAIDVWESVAAHTGLAYRYVPYPTISGLLDATRSSQIDIAVTNLTITRERAETISYTQPWYDAGLRIMVVNNAGSGFSDLLNGLRDAGHLRGYASLLVIVLLATLALTLFDRRFDREFPQRWREGIAESLFHVVSLVTSGKTTRKNLFGWHGRLIAAFWMICGVATLAYVTSSVTSVMTAISLTQNINSLADLPGKTVGVFTGSVAERFIGDLGISSISYDDLTDAVPVLKAGHIDAIVADAPILEHYDHSNPEQKMAVVGSIFHPDKYGFAFPYDSDLTTPVTLQVLEMQEDGTLAIIKQKYFGNSP